MTTDPNAALQRTRDLARHARIYPPADTILADLARAITDLDAHLSGGGQPPEAWREGPDAPHLDGADRFWLLTPDPEIPEHPTSLGAGWCGVVDEEAGGVVAWTHESNAAAVVRGLAGGGPDAPPRGHKDRLIMAADLLNMDPNDLMTALDHGTCAADAMTAARAFAAEERSGRLDAADS